MEDVFLFVLTLVGLLILWSLIRRIPSKNMKNFHIHFGFLKGFDMSGEFYKDDTRYENHGSPRRAVPRAVLLPVSG